LNTRFGDLDIMSTVPGVESFHELQNNSVVFDLDGEPAPTLNLSALIATKEAAADPNPRKQSALAYLKKLQSLA